MIDMAFIESYFNLNFTKMKKLNKLQINSERLMKKEELFSLRGGLYTYDCSVDGGTWWFKMSSVQDNEFAATMECQEFLGSYGTCSYCNYLYHS
jgi:hypothetical protein